MNNKLSSGRNLLNEYNTRDSYTVEIEIGESLNTVLAEKAQSTNTKKGEVARQILKEAIGDTDEDA